MHFTAKKLLDKKMVLWLQNEEEKPVASIKSINDVFASGQVVSASRWIFHLFMVPKIHIFSQKVKL